MLRLIFGSQLQEAYSTLCDPGLRRDYDSRYPTIQSLRRTRSAPQSGSCHNPGPENRTTEKDERLRRFRDNKACRQSELDTNRDELVKMRAELNGLEEEMARADAERLAKDTWWPIRFFFSRPQDTDAEKEEHHRRQLHRRAAHTIKKEKIVRQITKIQSLERSVEAMESQIKGVLADIQHEKYEAELNASRMRATKAAEERKKAEEERVVREARARQAREAREAREAEQKRAEQERIRNQIQARQAREVREAREAQEAQEAQERRVEEIRIRIAAQARKAQNLRGAAAAATEADQAERASDTSRMGIVHDRMPRQHHSSSQPTARSCEHRGFWPETKGAHRCQRCERLTTKFALQCPSCQMVACASCRKELKPPHPTKRNHSRRST
jgi:DNA repair exonuclease SbcCD ATPase subunit